MHLLWDFGGTLANSSPIWSPVFDDLAGPLDPSARAKSWDAWQSSFPWVQHTIPHAGLFANESYYEYLARTLGDALAVSGITLAVSTADLQGAIVARMQYVLVNGAQDALSRAASAGHTNHLASNHVPELTGVLTELRLRECFQYTFISGIIGHEKPSSGFWRTIEETLSREPGEIVMIGDDWYRDIEPSLARGYHAVWVASREQQAVRTASIEAAQTVDGIDLVPTILDKLETRPREPLHKS